MQEFLKKPLSIARCIVLYFLLLHCVYLRFIALSQTDSSVAIDPTSYPYRHQSRNGQFDKLFTNITDLQVYSLF